MAESGTYPDLVQNQLNTIRNEYEKKKSYSQLRLELETNIIRILQNLSIDGYLDGAESDLGDAVYPDKTKFTEGYNPKELNIFLKTLLVYSIQNYEQFKKYTFDLMAWFCGGDTYGTELSRVLRELETEYIGDLDHGLSVSWADKFVSAFGEICGQILIESQVLQAESREMVELCIIGFVKKWSTCNQKHWSEEATALGKFVIIGHRELANRLPNVADDMFRNIESIVLRDSVPKNLKAMYLRIMESIVHPQPAPEPKIPNEYRDVSKMLRSIHMFELMPKFMTCGIRDSTLVLPWSDIRAIMDEGGFKRGQIYEVKNYLAVRRGKLTRRGVLLPPSAFTLN